MPLTESSIKRLNDLFDSIYIDEFQDFRCEDFDLIITLAKGLHDITLVGDFYQHSVAANKNTGKPFKRGNGKGKDVGYSEFIQYMKNLGFEVDTDALRKSWRCSPVVCSFIQKKLGIQIESMEKTNGDVHFLDSFEAPDILRNENITKLVWDSPEKYPFDTLNWSYSKGDTHKSVCIILTGKFEKLDSSDFCIDQTMGAVSINRLYVAITRSSGDVYFIKKTEYESIGKPKQITLF